MNSFLKLLAFDYCKNLPYPRLLITQETLHVALLFTVHCYNVYSSSMYYFLEFEGKKMQTSYVKFRMFTSVRNCECG